MEKIMLDTKTVLCYLQKLYLHSMQMKCESNPFQDTNGPGVSFTFIYDIGINVVHVDK